eukprot:3509817-Prymnesium_polylepis.1
MRTMSHAHVLHVGVKNTERVHSQCRWPRKLRLLRTYVYLAPPLRHTHINPAYDNIRANRGGVGGPARGRAIRHAQVDARARAARQDLAGEDACLKRRPTCRL